MNCTEISRQIPLYCYGEISSEYEERIESHLAQCSVCREELARYRSFLELLDEREELNGAPLLANCRADLRSALSRETPRHTAVG